MDSSNKPLEYGKLYHVEKKDTSFVLVIEPDYTRPVHQQWVRIHLFDSKDDRFWTWGWAQAILSCDRWHWHNMAEILNDDQ